VVVEETTQTLLPGEEGEEEEDLWKKQFRECLGRTTPSMLRFRRLPSCVTVK